MTNSNRLLDADGARNDRQWDDILFHQGRGLQTAEMNELQTIRSEQVQGIADILMRDGAILSGASVRHTDTGVVNLEDATVYVSGWARKVAARQITIPTGRVEIGVCLETTILTTESADGEILRDQEETSLNLGSPGGDRTIRTVTWRSSHEELPPGCEFFGIFRFADRQLVQAETPAEVDRVVEHIAAYDRQATGGSNYTTAGNTVGCQFLSFLSYRITLTEGDARVFGFRVFRPQLRIIDLDDTSRLPAGAEDGADFEPSTIRINSESTSSLASNRVVTLRYRPVARVTRVEYTVENTANVVRGNTANSADNIGVTSVTAIVGNISVGGRTYVQGTNFRLVGDTVDWSLGGSEPTAGTSYTVRYQRTLTAITPNGVIAPSVVLLDPDGGTVTLPSAAVTGEPVEVDYRPYLPRWDSVAIDREGEIFIYRGTSDLVAVAPPTELVPLDQLHLADIYYNWRANVDPTVRRVSNELIAQSQLIDMQEAIRDLYKISLQTQLEARLAIDVPTAKTGVFHDPFLDDSLRKPDDPGSAIVMDGELVLPISTTISEPDSIPADLPLTLPWTEEIVLEQPLRTGSLRINPYAAIEAIPTPMNVIPPVDVWSIRRRETVTNTIGTIRQNRGWRNIITTTNAQRVFEEATTGSETMRTRSLALRIEGWRDSEELMSLEFAGQGITITPTPSADSSGVLTTRFDIPPNIPVGTVTVQAEGTQGSFSITDFTARVTRLVEQTVFTRTIRQQRVRRRRFFDPIAQTFVLPEDRQVSSVGIKFTAIGSTSIPVQIQIREVENGIPTQVVLGEGVIQGNDINLANVYTNCQLSSLVHLVRNVQYAIVILTNDVNHAVAIAEVGQRDNFANQSVSTQPYTVGVLLTSSNAATWTPHQREDLTFQLLAASFTSTSRTVSLGNYTLSGVTDITPNPGVFAPAGEVLSTYLNGPVTIASLRPLQTYQAPAAFTGTLTHFLGIRGSRELSPVVFSASTVFGALSTSATYNGRLIPIATGANTVAVYLEAQLAGGSLTLQVQSTEPSSLLISLLADTGYTRTLPDGWQALRYHAELEDTATNIGVLLTLNGGPSQRVRLRSLRLVTYQS